MVEQDFLIECWNSTNSLCLLCPSELIFEGVRTYARISLRMTKNVIPYGICECRLYKGPLGSHKLLYLENLGPAANTHFFHLPLFHFSCRQHLHSFVAYILSLPYISLLARANVCKENMPFFQQQFALGLCWRLATTAAERALTYQSHSTH